MFTAKNESELIELLKIVSEEAVSAAKSRLKESQDPYAESFRSRLDDTPFSIKEQEEEKTEKEPEDDKEKEASDEKPANPPETKDVPNNFGASIDSLQKNINALRAGKSLKDSTVNSQLQIYYDKLTEDERKVLVLFLRELSRILSGSVSGDDAVDPSDPPPGLNVDIISKDKKPEAEKPQAAPRPQSQQPAPEKRVTTGDMEDTTPPIRVNESQDFTLLRQKLQKLFGN